MHTEHIKKFLEFLSKRKIPELGISGALIQNQCVAMPVFPLGGGLTENAQGVMKLAVRAPITIPPAVQTVIGLKRLCKQKGIKGYSKMKKEELVKTCGGK
jgi:hypothetical protein